MEQTLKFDSTWKVLPIDIPQIEDIHNFVMCYYRVQTTILVSIYRCNQTKWMVL